MNASQHTLRSRASDINSGSALKIALILGLMILLCLASVGQASALPGTGRMGVLTRAFDFAGQLLASAAQTDSDLTGGDDSSSSAASSLESAVTTKPAGNPGHKSTVSPESGQPEGGAPAEARREPAYMPFMSFENLTEEQQ